MKAALLETWLRYLADFVRDRLTMSKLHRGKTCAYCGTLGASRTGDHVVARALVTEALRGEIPIVPACVACNGKKAVLEHYAASVLPFGGRHQGASASLTGVPKRLAKNQRLHRELTAGQIHIWSKESGLMMPCLSIPIEGERLEALVGYIVRGLLFHHWDVALGSDYSVEVYSLTRHGEQTFDRYLGMNAAQRVTGNVGQGVVVYRGVQAVDKRSSNSPARTAAMSASISAGSLSFEPTTMPALPFSNSTGLAPNLMDMTN